MFAFSGGEFSELAQSLNRDEVRTAPKVASRSQTKQGFTCHAQELGRPKDSALLNERPKRGCELGIDQSRRCVIPHESTLPVAVRGVSKSCGFEIFAAGESGLAVRRPPIFFRLLLSKTDAT